MNSITENLFDNYQRTRDSALTLDQFKRLLRLFPSLMVCMSDGTLDAEERVGIRQNIKTSLLHLAEPLTEKTLKALMLEVDYLSLSIDRWRDDFLAALKFELMISPDDKEFIMESLYLFANVHNGICIREQLQIDELVSELALAS